MRDFCVWCWKPVAIPKGVPRGISVCSDYCLHMETFFNAQYSDKKLEANDAYPPKSTTGRS